MDKISFDKNKLSFSSSSCYELSQKVLTDIDYIYNLISNLTNDNVWSGQDANIYMNIRGKDKFAYENFFARLKEYFLYLNGIGDEISSSSGKISIDGSLVSEIDCQLSVIENVACDNLNSAIQKLNTAYEFSSSLSFPYQFSGCDKLKDCKNKINEVINSCNDISSWLNGSINVIDSIFENVNADISKMKIDSIDVINSIVKDT